MPGRSDPTNALRQERHRLRKRALAAALVEPTDAAAVEERDQVRGAIAHLERLDRRHATEHARRAFAAEIEGSAAAVARKLVELALAGDATALSLVARSVLPPARTEDRRVRLDLP